MGGWLCHTAAIVLRGIELRRAPVLTLAEVVSLVIWLAVLLDLWVERRYGVTTFNAFILPVVLALGLGLPTGLRDLALEPRAGSAWILVHVALVLVGLSALVLNFGSAIMYLLQERQLKAQAARHLLLPPAVARDAGPAHPHDPHRGLSLPHRGARPGFRARGPGVGPRSRGRSARPLLAGDVARLRGHAVRAASIGHWRGRRAAYFSIAGFCVLLATLGAGVLFQGRHGS